MGECYALGMPRRLGQHFLRPASVERLLRLIAPQSDQVFLEIGGGGGALTLPLAGSRPPRGHGRSWTSSSPSRLREQAPTNVEVVIGDALDLDLRELAPRGARLVGNLPYYISSPLLRRFLTLRDRVIDFHVMVQEEVARRVASPPGNKDYGILSVVLGVWADMDVPMAFGPGAFQPPPRVRSAVLRGRFLERPRITDPRPRAFRAFCRKSLRSEKKNT